MFAFPHPLIWFEHEIAIDDHPHREARPDRQRRLNIEIALNDFLSGLIQDYRWILGEAPG